MTGIESTQVGAESLQHVAVVSRMVYDALSNLAVEARRAQFFGRVLNPAETEQALSDALADVNHLRALIAGLRDDAHQRAVEAATR